MLTRLQIENVAVIEKADVNFSRGLNVLTGETGAGKSILIDSINAILGNRTSRELVRTGTTKAVIRASFEDLPTTVVNKLLQAGYECEDSSLMVYREINLEGKSSCRINGMPATATVLRDICSGLVSIHGQHDSVGLTNPAKHEELLDAYAQNEELWRDYYVTYRELVKIKREMDALVTDEAEKQRRLDLLSYQVDEIEGAELTPGEDEELEGRRDVLRNAEAIRSKVASVYSTLSGGDEDGGVCDMLGQVSNTITAAARLDPDLAYYVERLTEMYYNTKEIATDLADRLQDYESCDGELDRIEQRLDLIYKLRRKYGETIEDILAFGDKARKELHQIQFSEQHYAELDAEKRRLFGVAREKANRLTDSRLTAFEQLNAKISQSLAFLNMPGVRFTLQHKRGPLASRGQDTVEFYISTNPGEAPKPLAKIASGGELSRIMLAVKSAMAERDAMPTVIYDEIDTGVSGKAAGKIGQTLKQNAQNHQILCITHTAQIAALADSHLLIQKNVENERTFTKIQPLDIEGRIHALASIISGDHVTELSLANAREMLQAN